MSEDNNIEVSSAENIDDLMEFATPEELAPAIEAVLFAHSEPLALKQLCALFNVEAALALSAINILTQKYQSDAIGVEVCLIADKYQIRTKNIYSSYIQRLKASKPKKLSPAALETLAIIAYRQPVVKSEIEKIRGVDVSPTLKTLLERKLIKIAGQQATPGQPSLYATTEEFLKVFGLANLGDLPNLREVEEIESSVGEFLANNIEEELEESSEEDTSAQ